MLRTQFNPTPIYPVDNSTTPVYLPTYLPTYMSIKLATYLYSFSASSS